MLRIHPNIFSKGLILVSVPLAFEFAFLLTYFQVQQNYDAVLEKEAQVVLDKWNAGRRIITLSDNMRGCEAYYMKIHLAPDAATDQLHSAGRSSAKATPDGARPLPSKSAGRTLPRLRPYHAFVEQA